MAGEPWADISRCEFVDVMDDDEKTSDQRMVRDANCGFSSSNLNWTTIPLYRVTTVPVLHQSNDKEPNYLICPSSILRRLLYTLIASAEKSFAYLSSGPAGAIA